MAILSTMEKRASIENPRTSLDKVFEIMDAGATSTAGVVINEAKALGLSAVWAASRVLSDAVAAIPLLVYERLERGKRRAEGHPLFSILHDQPNPEMSSFTYREVSQGHLTLWGNHYAEVERNGAGLPIALWPLLPDRTRPVRKNGVKWVVTRLANGQEVGLPPERYLHIPGFGFDGLVGYSVVTMARNSLGLGLATEEFGSRFFSNGARPSGVLEHPGKLSDSARQSIRGSWKENYEGLTNAQRTAILEEGMIYKAIGVPPEDAQFLETRRFQTTEYARWFKVPPHMIGDLTNATFSNIEHQGIEFVVHTVTPWLVRWEKPINYTLIPERERARFFAEFLVEGLLRGDSAARAAYHNQMIGIGIETINEARAAENLNAVEGGDVHLVPLNMTTLDRIGELLVSTDGEDMDDDDDRALVVGEIEGRAVREERSALLRQRLRGAQVPLFREVAGRIVTKEVGALRKAVRDSFETRSLNDFRAWMNRFYADHGRAVSERFLAGLLSYSVGLRQAIALELGLKDGPDVEPFVRAYAATLGLRWAKTSVNKLEKVIADLAATPDAIPTALLAQADAWETSRAERFSSREAVRAGEAIILAAYSNTGTVQRLRWRTIGKSCPLCNRMNNRIVGVGLPFLRKGEKVAGGEGQGDLVTWKTIKHPPLHGGCDCAVVSA